MAVEIVREVLGWCAVMNYSLLLLWFLMYALAHERLYRLHGTWFTLSGEKFAAIHYAGMAFFKLGIFLFNLAPYVGLRIVV